ncbi:putative UDP-glycosyltransferase 72B1 [Hypsibius exemplaris]|uniref:UDP-glucuronosyltransferase n=1 Tax=Hypsibius exemplaris TaxID=2072580 RepID=A0A1W0WJ03_HYPEX|nr:putative UDP-glycosyltransferase 72B1 [Hypsibius exemplaris]
MTPNPGGKLHVLIASFPAYGHIIPLYELAKKVGKHHRVTFAVSAPKLSDLVKREIVNASDPVTLFGIEDGLVDDFDNPTDPGVMARVFQTVLPAFAQLMTVIPVRNGNISTVSGIATPVDIVITDNFLGGPAAISHQRGIPFYSFCTANATMLQIMLMLNEDSPTVEEADAEPFVKLPEPGEAPRPVPEAMKKLFLPMRTGLKFARGIIINSLRELDQEAIRAIDENGELKALTFHFVGPLLPEEKGANSEAQLATEGKVGKWLDAQAVNSVVYVSFGSVATPKPEQVTIIGDVLLALGQPFIWALREKHHQHLPAAIQAGITKQFDGSNDSKFLILDWAPQKLVLAHAAVSVFVSHCGWNSSLEALGSGKPVVAWPMFADQLENGKWLERLGAAVLIPDTGLKSAKVVSVEELNEAVVKVGGWKGGEVSVYGKAAQTWVDKISGAWAPGGSSEKEFLDLIRFQAKE